MRNRSTSLLLHPFMLLLIFIIVAYLPVLLPFFHLKNDLVTQNLPTRFFVGESLDDGFFPWWNPYINYGLPQYGDMNHGFWNPVQWLAGSVFGYSLLTITLEEMVYILVGAWGLFLLCRQLKCNRPLSLVAAMCYACSGFVTGHLQHFIWITGVAFFPYVLLTFLKCISSGSIKDYALGGIACFLFIAATHPGLVIGALYFFLFLLLYLLSEARKAGNASLVLKRTVFFLVAALLSTPVVLFSNIEVLQHITRGEKVLPGEALQVATTLPSYLSLLFPTAVFSGDIFDTDISMRNVYMGLFLFPGLIFFFRRSTIIQKIICAVSLLFFILLAAGIAQRFFYELPLLGYVRLNGEFRYYALLIGLLGAARGWMLLLKEPHAGASVKRINKVLLVFCAGIALGSLYFIYKENGTAGTGKAGTTVRENIQHLLASLSFSRLLFVCAAIQTIFLLLHSRLPTQKGLVALTALNLILFTWLSLPFTGLGRLPRSSVQQVISSVPQGIPRPNMLPVSANQYIDTSFNALIGSPAFYSKQIGYPVQPPYPVVLTSTDRFYADKKLLEFINRQAWAFLATDTSVEAITAYDSSHIHVVSYEPTNIHLQVNNDQYKYLVLLQNNYFRWKVLVNGKETPHATAFKTFISVPLSQGQHEVEFRFDTTSLKIILVINVILLLLAFFIACFRKRNSEDLRIKTAT